jgi:DNA-binding NarL/FixJ family response regulator
MRALWIEDHPLIGDSLELLLQVVMPELSIDKARDLPTALGCVERIPYQLVLLDWWLGDREGGQTIEALRRQGCRAPMVVVSGDDRAAVMQRALQLGVAGYVRKSAEPSELISTLQTVLAGEQAALPPASTGPRHDLPALELATLYPQLSERQLEVFAALMRGVSDKQIARELGIGDTTVKTHVRAILQALGVHSRGEASFQARQAGARS